MNLRTIIGQALSRLHVSQPSPEQLSKGRQSTVRFFKEMSAEPSLNTNLQTAQGTLTTTEDDDINKFAITNGNTIVGIMDGKTRLQRVDLMAWLNDRTNNAIYAIAQVSDGQWTIYHKWQDISKRLLVYRADNAFELDDTLTLPEEFEPLLELYIARDLSRSTEQYNRFAAEYEAMKTQVKDSRLSLVLPVREGEDYCQFSRRWLER